MTAICHSYGSILWYSTNNNILCVTLHGIIPFGNMVPCIMQQNSAPAFGLHTRYGYEVRGMNLLQAYLYTYSLLRGIAFQVLLLSSCPLSPTVGNIFGTPVMEQLSVLSSHLLWMSSVSWKFRPFKADFIFWNSQKLFRAKSGE